MTSDSPRCSACGSSDRRTIFEALAQPTLVCILWPDAEAARGCPRGDIRLELCERCGMIENRDFDPALVEYTENYENSLGFSELFRGYLQGFAEDVVERHALRGKKVVELGSGDVEFLELLCELGGNEGIGFDPSYSPDQPEERLGGRVRIVRDYYSEKYEDVGGDLVACRQVLEHVPDPAGMMRSVRRTIGNRSDAAVVFEVPNVRHTFEKFAPWEIFYEHRSYFSVGSLARLFAATGFDVTAATDAYHGQFIAVHGRPAEGEPGQITVEVESAAELAAEAKGFVDQYKGRFADWRADLARLRDEGKRVVIWGSGARGVCFLNMADVDGTIEHGIDINPKKHGWHMPGTGQRIESPDFLRDYAPDVVIVMNGIYEDEISASLAEMGLDAEVRCA